MKKAIGVMMLACCALTLNADDTQEAVQPGQAAVDAGNKKCPVSGQPMNGQSSYTHNGKQYNLCGEDCKQEFANDPDKYAEIGDDEAAGSQQ